MFSCFFCCFAPLARGRQACRTRLPGRGTKWTRLPGRGQMGGRLPGVSAFFWLLCVLPELLFARTAPPATPRSPGRPRRLVSLWSSRELAPRGRAEAPCSAAPRVSTARAAGGRAVCVAPLWASAWSCAERVGGALTRAPRARMGTRRNPLSSAGCSHPRAHNTLCQAVQHAALVLCCGSRCWPAWLRDGVRRPAWAPAGCTRERRWQRTPDPISFPCRRLAGSAASCDPHSSHCPGSAAPLLVDRPAARHGSTRWSRGDVRSRGSVGTARGSVGELCLGTTSS